MILSWHPIFFNLLATYRHYSNYFAGIANGTDLTGNANVGYTTNGWSLINTSPYYFVRSGYLNDPTLYNFATSGYYWSSSAVSSEQAYYLYFFSDGLWPARQPYRSYGWSLRCVAVRNRIFIIFSPIFAKI